MRSHFLLLYLSLGICMVIGFSSCHLPSPPTSSVVLTTVFPVYDWCRQIIPPNSVTVRLIRLNPDLYGGSLSLTELKSLQEASLIIKAGYGLDNWINPYITDKSKVFELQQWEQDQIHDLTGTKNNTQINASNRYLWLDPIWAQDTVRGLSQQLQTSFPSIKDQIADRTQSYLVELHDLHIEILKILRRPNKPTFIVQNQIFHAFAKRYQLSTHPIELPADVPLPAETLKHASQALRKTNCPVIFVRPTLFWEISKSLEEELNCLVLPFDPLGDPNDSKRDGYIQFMRYNLESVKKGLMWCDEQSPPANN